MSNFEKMRIIANKMLNIRRWYLYDFANSFASSVIIFYFSLLLSEGGASDTWIGISAAISTVILLIFYPALGHKADRSQGTLMKYMRVSSVIMVFTLFAIGFLTNTFLENYTYAMLFTLCFLYILFQTSFQGSYVFYSSFMQHFKEIGYNKDKISGLGMGLGQLGNAVSIGVMGAFVVGSSLVLYSLSGKSLALVLGGTIFIVLAIPFLIQKSEEGHVQAKSSEATFSLKEFLRKVFLDKKVFYYLLGYMLVADSVSTLQIYLTLYLKNVFGFTEKMSSIGGAVSLGMLFITCMVFGFFAYKITNRNKMLVIGGSVYIIAFLLFGFAPNTPLYAYLSLIFAGFAYGLFFPLARSLYSDIIPKEAQAEYFSSFIIFERAATITGPLLWVVVFWLLSEYPTEFRYRTNVIILAFIAMIGIYYIKKAHAMVRVEIH
ncbi:MAG: MFS transporter [Candidatus Kaiserbacteria bacterium]|nr:MFS transporter [Candidatus Kaiserbacteria bacterium]